MSSQRPRAAWQHLILIWPLAVFASALWATQAGAAGCPNAQLRSESVYALRLPDCRAYEQVTPVGKNGANPAGQTDFVQASEDGQRILYLVPAGMPGAAGEGEYPSFLSARGSSSWASEGLLPPTAPGASVHLLGWPESLSAVAVESLFNNAPSTEGLELRQTADASLVQAVPGGFGYHVAAFSADLAHLSFETEAQLLPAAAPGVDNLYEWDANKPVSERLSLAGVLPDGSTPAEGSFAGSYNWAEEGTLAGGAIEHLYTQNTISSDGSRVIFTTRGIEGPTAKQLYVRENGTATVQASASQRSEPDPNGVKPAAFMAATPNGEKVFFTSCQRLTNDSTAVSTAAAECTTGEQGQDLYTYDTATNVLTDLTNEAVSDPATAAVTHGAAVQGVLGTSEDGSYVYFVANGVLASGAAPGSCVGIHTKVNAGEGVGACNLYVWHEGRIRFVARQTAVARQTENADVGNWRPTPAVPGNGQPFEKTARVTPDGLILLFRSKERLTPYDNRTIDGRGCNSEGTPSGEACNELYRYAAVTGTLTCVSCDPSGAAPGGNAGLQSIRVLATSPATPAAILTRNLAPDGARIVFESPDPLVPQDTNGEQDVYEWEANGSGTCEEAAGCIFLLSSGQSSEPSFFGDASTNGNDVFLFTSQQLVGQDHDQNVDVYDARVKGGLATQNGTAAVPCNGDTCRSSSPAQATFPEGLASATLSGAGNLAAPISVKPVTKPLTRRQKLMKALKVCRRKHSHHKRATCERQARKRYSTRARPRRRRHK